MKKTKRSCLSLGFILTALGFVAIAGIVMLFFVANRLQGINAQQFMPPNVIITAPGALSQAAVGDPIRVEATATGQNPIARMELWVDGALIDTKIGIETKAGEPMYGSYDYAVVEGTQVIIVRAVDTKGIVGQSQAVGINGVPKTGQEEAAYLIPVKEGDTLEKIAEENDANLADVQAANPGLAGQAPASGSVVQVPIKPKGENPAQPAGQPPAQAPAQPPGKPPVQAQVQPPAAAPLGNPLPLLSGDPVTSLANSLLPILGGQATPPPAPDKFNVTKDVCNLFMTWQDNAVNEFSYEVWIATPYMKSIAKLKPGPGTGMVWFKMKAPPYEKMVFWIEAVNQFGRSLSQMVSITNEPACAGGTAKELGSHVLFELMNANVNGPFDRLYCYVAEGNNPKTRIPNDDNDFIDLVNGKLLSFTGKSQFIVKNSESGILYLQGECWAWGGSALTNLGPFKTKYDTGNIAWAPGFLDIIGASGNYTIRFLVTALASAAPQDIGLWWNYGYSDPALPKPYDLQISPSPITYAPGDINKWADRNLAWKWDGDQSKIKGFSILRDGLPQMMNYPIPPAARESIVQLSKYCDARVRWEVAAVSNAGVAISAPFEHDLPKCEQSLVVRFYQIQFEQVYDQEDQPFGLPGGPCDQTAEGYFTLTVNNETRSFYTGPNYAPLKGCNTYNLLDLTGPYQNTYPNPTEFKVPWYSPNNSLKLDIKADFWDHNATKPNNLLVSFAKTGFGGWTVQQYLDTFPNSTECQTVDLPNTAGVQGKGTLSFCTKLETKPIGN